ncbi:MAG: 5-carboxymethyl-2-hydroxymuconate isomerase [Candidatus Reconcilbacillus cellulovorans]|uniref:5-carboxymethyl-2-hydroxymuconate isomerase n=1 Tax=Candidatus Reconcilbacillus cellulovorans TaxID=1906605 RepID=A0A2A6DZA6_9BACL|nr:MAG: 5-carboxymethyl-2-hydroxymuconate isomerase [Candidatus Reconcilbacillus cellulovorans]
MKLATIARNGQHRLGVWTEAGIVDVAAALQHRRDRRGEDVPTDVMALIAAGTGGLDALRSFLDDLARLDNEGAPWLIAEQDAVFGPCVPRPQKIVCVGLNYRKHAEETGAAIPEVPVLFSKFPNALAGHRNDIELPETSEKVDYEAELAVVIGRRARNVAKERALKYVFGYCPANDLSARDLQLRTSQWLLGKSLDGFAPIGPYLVTADEVGDPNRLGIRCRVNGELRQNSNTADMIFKCDELISYISRHMTLEPGDVVLTGTPEGVVLGLPPERQIYLRPGDVVEIEIEKLGTLQNRLVAPRRRE